MYCSRYRIKGFFITAFEFVEQDGTALAQDRKFLWIEFRVPHRNIVLRGTFVRTREHGLLLHHKALGVVVNSAKQNHSPTKGKALGDQRGPDPLHRFHIFGVRQAASSHHAGAIAISQQGFAEAASKRSGPDTPVRGVLRWDKVPGPLCKNLGGHLVDQLFLALEMPVNRWSLDLELLCKESQG